MGKLIDLNNLNKNESILLNKIYLKNKKHFIKNLYKFTLKENKFSIFHPLLCKLNDNYLFYKELCYLKLCIILTKKNKFNDIEIITRNITEYFF